LLPGAAEVAAWAAALGLTQDRQVVVYDAGKATAAARALWVLNAYGFNNVRWLNGGIAAWTAAGHPVSTDVPAQPNASDVGALQADPAIVVNVNDLLIDSGADSAPRLNRQPIDTRSLAEYTGEDVRSARGGHMPNAVHYEWLELFADDGRLRSDDELNQALRERAINPDTPSVVYCQTHQRSAVTYVVLKHLGFNDVAALDGAWSNWGNDPNTPIET